MPPPNGLPANAEGLRPKLTLEIVKFSQNKAQMKIT